MKRDSLQSAISDLEIVYQVNKGGSTKHLRDSLRLLALLLDQGRILQAKQALRALVDAPTPKGE